MKIEGKVAVVTGGASGLGQAVVQHLLSLKARVIVFDIIAVERDNISNADFYSVDVTDEAQIRQAMEDIHVKHGAVHICINCAGIAPAQKLLDRDRRAMPLDDFRRVININLIGTLAVSSLAAEQMAINDPEEGERGVIINTASIAAYEGQKGQCAYAASKGAIASLTLPMARDLASHGIRVVSIAPGVMATPMMQSMPTKVQEGLNNTVPFPKRMGKPMEFALLAAHIVSNAYINAEVIRLDGALRMA